MRKFIYENRSFPDPDESLPVDEVRKSLAHFFPELSNATATERKEGEDTIITLEKKVGTKGCHSSTRL